MNIQSDEELVSAVRHVLGKRLQFREVRMFGGTGFLMDGKMFVGTSKRGLLVRVGKQRHAEALESDGVTPMVMGGRVKEGFVFVDPQVLDTRALRTWIRSALDYVQTLPAKQTKRKATGAKEKTV